MKFTIRSGVATVALTITSLFLFTGAVLAQGPTPQPTPIPSFQEQQQAPMNGISDTANKNAITAKGLIYCNFFQLVDYPHISTWNDAPGAARAASAHGWWRNGDCKATTANVTVELQVNTNGSWRTVSTGKKNGVYQNGGSANRASTFVVCSSTKSTRFRALVDADLVGVADAANKTVSPEVVLACRPQGY